MGGAQKLPVKSVASFPGSQADGKEPGNEPVLLAGLARVVSDVGTSVKGSLVNQTVFPS